MEPPNPPGGHGHPSRSGPNKQRPGDLLTPSATESSGESDPVITVLSARYRAAWPQLRPRPFEWSQTALPTPVEKRRGEIEWQARRILREHRLFNDNGYDDVELIHQQMASQPCTSVPTIAINVPWSEDKKRLWESAIQGIAVELYKMYKDSDFNYEDIHIDMQSPELTQTIYYGPVNRESLCRTWDTIREIVYQRLESFKATAGCMTSICLFNYGLQDIDNNPPTIYIAVDYKSSEIGWSQVVNDIKSNISRHNREWAGVNVHIEHNVGMNYGYDYLEPTSDEINNEDAKKNKFVTGDYQQIIKPGDEFGAETYIVRSDGVKKTAGVGTIGCFVEIKTKNNPTWTRYALTNYHTVRSALPGFRLELVGDETKPAPPELNSDCWRVDLEGYFPTHNAQPVSFGSPSRTRHNFTLGYLKNSIKEDNQVIEDLKVKLQTAKSNRSTQKTIDRLQESTQKARSQGQQKDAFFNDGKHVLGTLFAASGYKRRASHGSFKMRLDWALINVHGNRQGPNILPSGEAWERKYPGRHLAQPTRTFDESLQRQSNPFGPGFNSLVFKVGGTTGLTIGKYHRTKSSCTMAEDAHVKRFMAKDYESTEYVVQPVLMDSDGQLKFCAHGDSGSVVFDRDGGVLGLFFRGSKPRNSADAGYGLVTPIELVFKDIIAFSKGGITEIRVAED
ncbi:hypothetical protein SNK03_013229 [Fusarium graminearum]